MSFVFFLKKLMNPIKVENKTNSKGNDVPESTYAVREIFGR